MTHPRLEAGPAQPAAPFRLGRLRDNVAFYAAALVSLDQPVAILCQAKAFIIVDAQQ
jgi:hypothetical protein